MLNSSRVSVVLYALRNFSSSCKDERESLASNLLVSLSASITSITHHLVNKNAWATPSATKKQCQAMLSTPTILSITHA